jgi:hypothetical protein
VLAPPLTQPGVYPFKHILKLDRLRLRGPNGARGEFHLAAIAQNLRRMAKLIPMPEPKPHDKVAGFKVRA